MNHKHRKILHSIFAHPIPANLSQREVESVVKEMGGDIEQHSGGRVGLRLNGHSAVFPHSGHSLPKNEVQQIRKFLESCGVDPAKDYPL
ncbi:MAG: hypothetical protein QNJ84_12945 [Alphaproteobacteria bacterium]|nr:hypothetical protein [Alphaproteobacteria bacterium]